MWEVEAGTSIEAFVRCFIKQALEDRQPIIYISFNKSPQSIVSEYFDGDYYGDFTLIDCFCYGKGKGDSAFLRFYDKGTSFKTILVKEPANIEQFTKILNEIEDKLPSGARYIFDSLTGIQTLWASEEKTFNFFNYMCPRLFDLQTIAYWILEKDAHSPQLKANIRHITQVALELYKRREKQLLKAIKLDRRTTREAFMPHYYEVLHHSVQIIPHKTSRLNIGDRIRDFRTRLNMSQKELSEKIGVTASFISQVESNQISPSLNTFVQIAEALGISASTLLAEHSPNKSWLITSEELTKNIFEKTEQYAVYCLAEFDKLSVYYITIDAQQKIKKHFFQHKKEDFVYIIKGEVSVTVGSETHLCKTSDCLILKDTAPSQWHNASDEVCELLLACA